ncbi:MAG TPA: carboxymuconolactone decarboxylase family protein [Sphingomonadaceae bacterium]|nr:carboxymuconolactone decarboxylase family protein [Sphingomonadaceae bacterium]
MGSGSDAYRKGIDLRRHMFGHAGAEGAHEAASDIGRPLQEYVTEFCFGEIWQREGLTNRERSMLVVAMLLGANRMKQVRVHLQGALANGVEPEELREVFLLAMEYLGIPAAAEATFMLEAMLKEEGG